MQSLHGIEWNSCTIEMNHEEVKIWKEFVVCLIVLSQKSDCGHWYKLWQTSMKLVSNLAVIQTWNHPIASLEYYWCVS